MDIRELDNNLQPRLAIFLLDIDNFLLVWIGAKLSNRLRSLDSRLFDKGVPTVLKTPVFFSRLLL